VKLTVDDIDRAILSYLYEDGRMSCAQIARRVGNISVRTVNNRIRRLTQKGIVKVRAVAFPEAVGYDIVADVSIEVEPGKARKVAEGLLKLGRVNYVAIVTGESDLSVAVYAADPRDLQTFIHEQLQQIPGVQRTRTSLITEILTRSADWRIPAELP